MPDHEQAFVTCTATLRAPEARSVGLAGDFNGWRPSPMDRGRDGVWRGRTPPLERMPLIPIQVRYKFVIDGDRWVRDPDNPLEVAGDSVIELAPRDPGPEGDPGRVEEVWFRSRHLGRDMRFFAWLPPGYDADDERRYPVVLLLHGYNDGGAPDFLVKGRVDRIAQRLLAADRLAPMILVMPEAEGSFYADRPEGSGAYEQYIVVDLLEEIDQRYRTWGQRAGRGIGGLSMGGFGAMKLALQYPDRFASVTSHAGVYDVRDLSFLPEVFGHGEGSMEHRRWNSPIRLVEDARRTRGLALYFDCGNRDHLLEEGIALHHALELRGIPHRFEIRPGFHAWDFVQRRLPFSLAWHARVLRPAG